LKRIALLMLAFLLCSVQGMAEGEPGTGEGTLSVKLERFEASSGMASMTLRLESRSAGSLRVYLVDPTFNGAPGAFSNGWNADEITVEANDARKIDISILPGHGEDLPETVSLRFAADGAVSSPMAIRRADDGFAVTEPVFDLPAGEPLMQADQPIPGEVHESERRILSDKLSADEKARLNYGRAVICLRETGNGEARFVRFCALPAVVNDDGSVYADYSGYTVTFSAAPDFPLSTVEAVQDGLRHFSVSRILLTGEAVFYADLAFELRQTADGALAFGGYSVNSEELGGAYHSVPRALFSGLSSANAVLTLDTHEGIVDARAVDDRFLSLPLESALEVEVKPSAALGEVYAFFEYHLADNRIIVHSPFPL